MILGMQNVFAVNQLNNDNEITDFEVWYNYEERQSFLKGKLQSALYVPEKIRSFLTKNVNRWGDRKGNGYMDMQRL